MCHCVHETKRSRNHTGGHGHGLLFEYRGDRWEKPLQGGNVRSCKTDVLRFEVNDCFSCHLDFNKFVPSTSGIQNTRTWQTCGGLVLLVTSALRAKTKAEKIAATQRSSVCVRRHYVSFLDKGSSLWAFHDVPVFSQKPSVGSVLLFFLSFLWRWENISFLTLDYRVKRSVSVSFLFAPWVLSPSASISAGQL